MKFYQQVLPLYQKLHDAWGESTVVNNIGAVYRDLGQPREALKFYQRALLLSQKIEDWQGATITLSNIGAVYLGIGHPREALKFYNRALSLSQKVGDRRTQASILSNIAAAYQSIGQPEQALKFYDRALPLRSATEDLGGEAVTLNNIGAVYLGMGQPQQALRFYNRALPLVRKVMDKRNEAMTLTNIGLAYQNTGQPQRALEFMLRALPMSRQVSDKRGEAIALNNIGLVYRDIGQPEQALHFMLQAWPLLINLEDRQAAATVLTNIGFLYAENGQETEALKVLNERALPLLREVEDRRGEAMTLNNTGLIHQNMDQFQEALKLYQQALPLFQQAGDKRGEAVTLNNIGIANQSIGQRQQALQFYTQALSRFQESEFRMGEATALSNLAAVEEAQGQLDEANDNLLQALTIYEGMRESLGGSSEAKVSLLELNVAIYHQYINLLLKQHKEVEAFEWAQKTKARALLDLMYDGKVDLSKGVSEADRRREGELKWRSGQLLKQLLEEANKPAPNKAKHAALREQLAQSESELARFTDSLHAKYPDLARKRAAKTVTLNDVATFLPPNAALLEYVVLKTRDLDRTVLFCVTVEQGKPVVKTYLIEATQKQLNERVDDFHGACSNPRLGYEEKAKNLYTLLVAPAAKQLAGKKQLIVCPDGPLWEFPFQALLARNETSGGNKFLIEQYEINYAYSATAVQAALLARTNPGRAKPPGTLFALADPDFGGKERIIGSPSRPITIDLRPITIDLRDGGGLQIKRLEGTQKEAMHIKDIFPDALIRTGKEAQEALAKQESGKFRYVHFATHGLFNDAAPMMSSIILAEPPAGSSEDGLLTAREIFDLNLSADMVVLSACDTARGEKRNGEGVVGLTWALFVAGAPTQVLSQWAVADQSTAELMRLFYEQIKSGKPKGAALREASLALMRDGQHRHPFHWAPFVLMGDWH